MDLEVTIYMIDGYANQHPVSYIPKDVKKINVKENFSTLYLHWINLWRIIQVYIPSILFFILDAGGPLFMGDIEVN